MVLPSTCACLQILLQNHLTSWVYSLCWRYWVFKSFWQWLALAGGLRCPESVWQLCQAGDHSASDLLNSLSIFLLIIHIIQCTNVLSGCVCWYEWWGWVGGWEYGSAEEFAVMWVDQQSSLPNSVWLCVHATPGSWCLWGLWGAFVLLIYMLVCQLLAHWEA